MKYFESFFWGMIAALSAIVIQLVFSIIFSTLSGQTSDASYASYFSIPSFVVAVAFIEEFFKYLILKKRIAEISSPKTFLLNVIMMGLGFFAIELALILKNSSTIQLRAIIEIATLHIGTTMLIGNFVFAESSKKISAAILSLLLATIFHSFYNLFVLQEKIFFDYLNGFLLILLLFFNLKLFFHVDKPLARD